MKLRQKKLYQNSIYVLKLRRFGKNLLNTNRNKDKDKSRPKIKVNKQRQLKLMENKQKYLTSSKSKSKMKKDQNKLFEQKQHIQLIRDQIQSSLEINRFDQPVKKDKIFEERKEILYNLIQKCQKVYQETQPSKYFSRNLYNKINENDQGFNLTQDQKKSLQSNLIYSILKYLQWNNIVAFFKKNRCKVKILKISTFEEHVLKGKLFLKCQAVQNLQINSQILLKALIKLQDTIDLYQNICQKKVYIKLYQQNIQLFKQKMILCIYKIIQFKELLKKYYEQNYKQFTKNDPIEDILHQIDKLPKKCSRGQKKDIFNNLMSTNFSENEQFISYSNLPPIPLTYNLQQDDFFSQQMQNKSEQNNEKKIRLSNQDEIFIEDIDSCQDTYNQRVQKLHPQN